MECQALRREVRETVEENTYFSACSIGPQLRSVGEALAEFVRCKEKLPLDYNRIFGSSVGPAREKLGQFLHAGADEIAFCGSVAQAINTAAWCIPFEPGDNVILCDREFASNVYPWIQMGKRRGVEVRIVPHDGGGLTVERLQEYADVRTRAVAVSAVEFGDGFRTDLKAIGEWCDMHGAYLVVDSAQALGILPIDVQSNNISFLAGCGAKWMLSGFGTGFLYVRKELISQTEPPFPAADSMDKDPDCIDYSPRYKATAARFETGAQNLPGIVALGKTIALCQSIGYEQIYAVSADVSSYFLQRLLHMGIQVAPCALEEKNRSAIISFEMPDPQAACAFLNANHVSCDVRVGRIRTGIHGYNTREEADRVCDLLKEFRKK